MGRKPLLLVSSRASRAESDLAERITIVERAGVSVRLERPADVPGALGVFADSREASTR